MSLPGDCRSFCRQTRKRNFIFRKLVGRDRRAVRLIATARPAVAPYHLCSFIAALRQMHGFEMERLTMQLGLRDFAVALKFPGKHGSEIVVVAHGFAVGRLMFFAKMRTA